MDGRVLRLTLKKEWFDLMVSGRKKVEYRKKKEYWNGKLLKKPHEDKIPKDFDLIRFYNGGYFGKHFPYFICKFKGIEISKKTETIVFEKSKIKVNRGDYKIFLGKIIKIGNVKKLHNTKSFSNG